MNDVLFSLLTAGVKTKGDGGAPKYAKNEKTGGGKPVEVVWIYRVSYARIAMRLKVKAYRRSMASICALIGLIVIGCYWYQKKAIVGFWSSSDGDNILEFRNDGIFINHDSGTNATAVHYSYSPLGRNNLKIESSTVHSFSGRLTVSVRRDVMTVSPPTAFDTFLQFHRVDASKTNALSIREEIEQQRNQWESQGTNLLQRLRR